jgi:hypothetical protein
MKYVEFMKKVVPAARRPVRLLLRGAAGLRRGRPAAHSAGLLGIVQRSRRLRLHLQEHDRVGPRCSSPRRGGRRQAGHHRSGRHQPEHPHPARQLLLRRLEKSETFVKTDPLGNPVDQRHPWNQTTIPRPQKRDFNGKYTWVMSPRWFDKRTGDHLALDTGGGPIARLWATALAGLVDIGYIKATGHSVKIYLPKTRRCPKSSSNGRFPSGATPSSATARAPTSRPTRGCARCTLRKGAGRNCTPAGPRPGPISRCRTRPSAAASTKRCAACCRITW